MADLNSNEEPQVLPSKRNHTTENPEGHDSTKKLRSDSAAVEDEIATKNGENDEIKDQIEDDEEEEEDYDGEDETDSEDEDDDDDEGVEHSNGGGEVDRKGKGIMKDDYKGKGKMIEESEDDDDDDSDDDGGDSESDGDDDLSDDPLMEVDLDNILPSRTRRRTAPSGVHISSDEVTNEKRNDA